MKRLNLIALAMLVGLISSSAWAAPVLSGSPRTFVSISGRDQGSCQNPCLTFQYALSQTGVGGEVIAVDSGNFGPVTITNSVTIEAAPGVYAGITPVASNAGVTVNGISGASVVLRGLTIPGGSGGDGIDFNSGLALAVENCVINGVIGNGINDTSSGNLSVKDTVIRNCGGDGVNLNASGAHASLSHVWLENNNVDGLEAPSGAASISNSVISDNSKNGIAVDGGEVNVEGCQIANNGHDGVFADSGTARVSNSTVTDNDNCGFDQFGGTFYSRQNNTVAGNDGGTCNAAGIITPFGGI